MSVIAVFVGSLAAVSAARAPSSEPPTPVMRPIFAADPQIARHQLIVAAGGYNRRWVRAIRDLMEDRFDVDSLPARTPLTVWTVDDELIAFKIQLPGFAGDAFAARIDNGGAQRWVFDDGSTIDGPVLSRPVRYLAITSKIGLRDHPLRRRVRFHAGTDYAAPIGTPVRVIAAGVVHKATRNWSAGKFVVVKHDDGHVSKYLHLDKHAPGIAAGVRVRQGEIIGTVGKTGAVTGPHLHFEVRDRWRRPIDPIAAPWPGNEVVAAEPLRLLRLRRELLLTWREDGTRDRFHPLALAPERLERTPPMPGATPTLPPPMAPLRRLGTLARLGPAPHRRRRAARFARAGDFPEDPGFA